MNLSLLEFVSFIARQFDYRSDVLEEAWSVLDSDRSGSISADEWESIVKDKLQFFGATRIIFNYLDKDDEGTVSLDEFMALEKFMDQATAHMLSLRNKRMAITVQ